MLQGYLRLQTLRTLTSSLMLFTRNGSFILRNYSQGPNNIMENQGENKSRTNAFDFHEFIHFIADLIEPFFHVLPSNILYILYI